MKIPIKKYVMDESLSWEERYKQLENHHKEETEFLFNKIQKLEDKIYDLEWNCQNCRNYIKECTCDI